MNVGQGVAPQIVNVWLVFPGGNEVAQQIAFPTGLGQFNFHFSCF